jgi:hypothetical protein
MIQFLKTFKSEIERYCRENNLSADKVFSSAHCGNKEWVALQHTDPNSERAKLGLLDNIPAPITLKIFLENGKVHFEQTEITHKYLSVDRKCVITPKKRQTLEPAFA